MDKNKDFLLEVGTEELPASYIKPVLAEMKKLMENKLAEKRIVYTKFNVYGTPRRLVLLGEKVALKGQEDVLEITGPPKNKAFDENNRPTPVAIGFAKKQGVDIDELFIKNTDKGEYVYIKKKQPQEDTIKVLTEAVPEIISSINFPKAMRWVEGSNFQFARPIRWITCLYGDKVVKFSFLNIKAGNYTYGLYSLSRKKIVISNINKYKEMLKNEYVIVDFDERKDIINKSINLVIRTTGGKILEDEKLLEEITFLLEYPTAVLGSFPEKYLDLPREVLITCMRHHQRYFSVVDSEGKLLPYFVSLRNGISEYLEILKEGLKKVLVARLEDAEFYFKQDTKRPLEEKVEKLKKVVYHNELGSLYDKVRRIVIISEFIADKIGFKKAEIEQVKRIALLCKADLVSEMVGEFPELQGIMGRVYAHISGEGNIVAEGIEQHYLPLSNDDAKLPVTMEASVVSIADKIDTVVGNFCVGLIPSGSQDPYGLKKQAQGIIRIIMDKQWKLSLDELINLSIGLFNLDLGGEGKKDLKNKLSQLFRQRMESVFCDLNLGHDEIAASLDVGFTDVADTFKRSYAIHKFRHLPDFINLISLFKRARNIVKQAEKEGMLKDDRHNIFNAELLKEPDEKELWQIFDVKVKGEAEKLLSNNAYEEVLQLLLTLEKSINSFFDKVMVMAEEESLRNNRLTLLENIVKLFLKVADFSKIVIEGKK